jgi:hypothetical protein
MLMEHQYQSSLDFAINVYSVKEVEPYSIPS